jgi:membrane associated rhomboid family serine protease
MVRWYFYFRFFRLSVRWALVLWIGLQLLGAWQQIAGFSNVSALGHLGGAAVGAGFYYFTTRPPRDPRRTPGRDTGSARTLRRG